MPSVEPSSTTMICSGGSVCPSSAAMVSGRAPASLCAATSTQTLVRIAAGAAAPAIGTAAAAAAGRSRSQVRQPTKASSTVSYTTYTTPTDQASTPPTAKAMQNRTPHSTRAPPWISTLGKGVRQPCRCGAARRRASCRGGGGGSMSWRAQGAGSSWEGGASAVCGCTPRKPGGGHRPCGQYADGPRADVAARCRGSRSRKAGRVEGDRSHCMSSACNARTPAGPLVKPRRRPYIAEP